MASAAVERRSGAAIDCFYFEKFIYLSRSAPPEPLIFAGIPTDVRHCRETSRTFVRLFVCLPRISNGKHEALLCIAFLPMEKQFL